jgi:hypothetical protein
MKIILLTTHISFLPHFHYIINIKIHFRIMSDSIRFWTCFDTLGISELNAVQMTTQAETLKHLL